MKLDTKHFGEIEIDDQNIIDFPEGIPAFENVHKFVLIGNHDEESPFLWLQSVDNTDLAFVMIDPYSIQSDYEVDIDDSEVEILNIKDTNKVLVYCIVVIPDDITQMTANLRAPILINTENNIGKQVVMDNSDYKVKHYIIEELKKIGG